MNNLSPLDNVVENLTGKRVHSFRQEHAMSNHSSNQGTRDAQQNKGPQDKSNASSQEKEAYNASYFLEKQRQAQHKK